MATCNINELLRAGACYLELTAQQQRAVELQLLCAILDAGSSTTWTPTSGTLNYAATVTANFDGDDYQTVTLAGDIDFSASSNRGAAKSIAIRVLADGSDRALTFNANWRFLGAIPASIAANKVGVLSLTAFGNAETDVVAVWAVEA